jgi:hypothetical protein
MLIPTMDLDGILKAAHPKPLGRPKEAYETGHEHDIH